MYNENDYVIYKKDVCRVKQIKENKENGKKYYILSPINDKSLSIETPADNSLGYIRDIMTKEKALEWINMIPKIDPIDLNDEKKVEKIYKELLQKGTPEDLIKIIKTTYLRNENRLKNKKKKNEKDDLFFNLAETYLYTEIGIALEMSFDETKQFIINRIQKLLEEK